MSNLAKHERRKAFFESIGRMRPLFFCFVFGACFGVPAGMYFHHTITDHTMLYEVEQVRRLLDDRRNNIVVISPEVAKRLNFKYDHVLAGE